jgi:hypothetical protein
MEQAEKTAVNKLVDNNDFRNFGTATHQQSDVWMPQNALHDDFILDLRE